MKRKRVINKRMAAKKFNRSVAKTKVINLAPKPMRGGQRM